MNEDILKNIICKTTKLKDITILTSRETVNKLWSNHAMECHRKVEKIGTNVYSLPQKTVYDILLNSKDSYKNSMYSVIPFI